MAFSGALTLTDLNDFITPSQACIKPVEQTNKPEMKDPGAATTQIQVDSSGSYYEISADIKSSGKKLQTAEISLNDCLACSGCITSAESVLITLQSHTEVLNFLQSNPTDKTSAAYKVPVLSIAPQSLASLAASVSSSSAQPVTLARVLSRVRMFCTQVLGFSHVFDTTFARHVALLEHAREFRERRRGGGKLPMLASACPGWICYAEKTHAEMLPFIGGTKSPQQVMGTLVKSWMGAKWNKRPDQIYHVTVMPCYDKKLEASRQDFYSELYATRDVDCVITTGELELLMREKDWDLSHALSVPVPLPPGGPGDEDTIELPELLAHPGTSSGSYLQSLISMLAADASPSTSVSPGSNSSTSTARDPASPYELSVRTVRTVDYEEYMLTERTSGTVVFKGAKCYGFRNLQNVVRKVGREAGVQVGRGAAGRMATVRGRARPRKGDAGGEREAEKGYDYVEVMACPGGCVNGGGQLRPPAQQQPNGVDAEGYARNWEENGVKLPDDSNPIPGADVKQWGDREWTKQVEEAYWRHGLPTPPSSPGPDGKRKPAPMSIVGQADTGAGSESGTFDLRKAKQADHLAVRILLDLCLPGAIAPNDEGQYSWDSELGEEAETRRRSLFRTQYHAVESEVVGLAVKW